MVQSNEETRRSFMAGHMLEQVLPQSNIFFPKLLAKLNAVTVPLSEAKQGSVSEFLRGSC